MKFLRNLVVAVGLMFTVPAIAQDKSVSVEYNIASCGSHDFTVIHVVLNEDRTKATFGDFLISPTTIKKEDNPVVFDWAEKPKNENGIIQFTATTTYEKSKLEINGARLGNRIIGILTVNGDLGHLYYGYVGSHDDLTVGVEEQYNNCNELQSTPDDQIRVEKLLKFLLGGSTGPDTTKKS
jgi:hypothetical protein